MGVYHDSWNYTMQKSLISGSIPWLMRYSDQMSVYIYIGSSATMETLMGEINERGNKTIRLRGSMILLPAADGSSNTSKTREMP